MNNFQTIFHWFLRDVMLKMTPMMFSYPHLNSMISLWREGTCSCNVLFISSDYITQWRASPFPLWSNDEWRWIRNQLFGGTLHQAFYPSSHPFPTEWIIYFIHIIFPSLTVVLMCCWARQHYHTYQTSGKWRSGIGTSTSKTWNEMRLDSNGNQLIMWSIFSVHCYRLQRKPNRPTTCLIVLEVVNSQRKRKQLIIIFIVITLSFLNLTG